MSGNSLFIKATLEMIVNEKNNIVETSEGISQQSFTIKATAKAFKILSSGLYSDKILAVIRELSCNAYDSHVAAGKKDVPFEVTMPTELDPQFKVKDFGVGLNHDGVMRLYSTYFESTKTDSNDFIGALGLGSKSPFSYVDSFSVVSVFNGFKTFYTAFIGSTGTPSIALMSDAVETDEPNGLEVSFPVKLEDMRVFSQKASFALKYFNPRPTIKNGTIQFNERTYIREEDGWKLVDTKMAGFSPVAIQGNVAYPISFNALTSHMTLEESSVVSLPIEYMFNIGDLEPAASREELSYEAETIVKIRARLRKIYDILLEENKDFYSDCSTEFEARAKYGKIFGTSAGRGYGYNTIPGQASTVLQFIYNAVQKGIIKLEWNGMLINSSSMSFEQHVVDYEKILQFDVSYSGRSKTFDVYKIALTPYYSKAKFDCNMTVQPMFWFDDLQVGGTSRLNTYLKKTACSTFFCKPMKDVAIADAKKAFQAIIDSMPGVSFRCTSELPAVKRELNESSKGTSAYELIYWKGYDSHWNKKFNSACWGKTSVGALDDVVYYFPVYDYRVVRDLDFVGIGSIGSRALRDMDSVVLLLQTHGKEFGLPIDKNTKIIGMRKKDMFLAKDDPSFINVLDVIRQAFASPATVAKLATVVQFLQGLSFISEKSTFVTQYVNDHMINKLDKACELAKFLSAIHQVKKTNQSDLEKIGKGLSTLENSLSLKIQKTSTFSETYETLVRGKYPMLQYITEKNLTEQMKIDVATYVSTVNIQQQLQGQP